MADCSGQTADQVGGGRQTESVLKGRNQKIAKAVIFVKKLIAAQGTFHRMLEKIRHFAPHFTEKSL